MANVAFLATGLGNEGTPEGESLLSPVHDKVVSVLMATFPEKFWALPPNPVGNLRGSVWDCRI
jgi:hypothetical protein